MIQSYSVIPAGGGSVGCASSTHLPYLYRRSSTYSYRHFISNLKHFISSFTPWAALPAQFAGNAPAWADLLPPGAPPPSPASLAPVVQQQDAPDPPERRRCDSDPGALSVKALRLLPLPFVVGAALLRRHHYLHSASAGHLLMLGVFSGPRLLGVLQLSRGARLAHRLLQGAAPEQCATLARLWLSDALPKNAESRVLSVLVRRLPQPPKHRYCYLLDPAGRARLTVPLRPYPRPEVLP